MKTLLLLFTSFLLASQSWAIRPCAPTVELDPLQLHCQTEAGSAKVEIFKRVSPDTPACEMDYQVVQTAKVSISEQADGVVQDVYILDGDFTYDSKTGEFWSHSRGLYLSECADI